MKKEGGGERLFPQSEWCPSAELRGTDIEIINHPFMEKAFKKVCAMHQPVHDVAVLALCTAQRPYSSTPTWSALRDTCEGWADPIVTSNGGVVPLGFEGEWPYTVYDAPGSSEHDAAYVEALAERLVRFFSMHNYEKIIGVFLPGKRNRQAVKLASQVLDMPYTLVPSRTLWMSMAQKVTAKDPRKKTEKYKRDGFMWSPLAHPLIQQAILKHT